MEKVKVLNRNNGSVGYEIPDMNNLHRQFSANEEKEITAEELQKLSYVPGGEYILKNYLVIKNNPELIKELLGDVEPEYFFTVAEIDKLLKTGSLEELQDALDFAPDGTKELIKQRAVSLEINDLSKREAIQQMTGLNVNSAININNETKDEHKEEVKPGRRADTAQAPEEKKIEEKTRRVETVKASDLVK